LKNCSTVSTFLLFFWKAVDGHFQQKMVSVLVAATVACLTIMSTSLSLTSISTSVHARKRVSNFISGAIPRDHTSSGILNPSNESSGGSNSGTALQWWWWKQQDPGENGFDPSSTLLLSRTSWLQVALCAFGFELLLYGVFKSPASPVSLPSVISPWLSKSPWLAKSADLLLSSLASSCCWGQLVLNSFNVGCAGFNSLLGPWRPFFIGMTIAAQTARCIFGGGFSKNKVSLVVSVVMTLLPELLWLYTAGLKQLRSNMAGSQHDQKSMMGEEGIFSYVIRVQGMGCIACKNKVERVLARTISSNAVVSSSVDLTRGFVHLRTRSDGSDKDISEVKNLCFELSQSGYPSNLLARSLVSEDLAHPVDVSEEEEMSQ
jgi:hypothetical protein